MNLDWMALAVCASDPERMFPQGELKVKPSRRRNRPSLAELFALELCEVCPVLASCSPYSLGSEYGVAGGMTEVQRMHARRAIRERHPRLEAS